MATYVLIHGAWHGGWCWHRIVARLRRARHQVIAPDLKGLGRDRTPPGTVTLCAWTDQISAIVRAQSQPVVLVGHSRGGIVLSEVAERIPDRIAKLVYVSAFLLENGRSLMDAAGEIHDSLVVPAMLVSADRGTVSLREDAVRDAFYAQCSDEDAILAQSLLVPEPLAPLSTPVSISAANFGRVPRAYIECMNDRAITLDAQHRMQATLPCAQRVVLDSDHSPFLCRSDELTEALLGA